LEKLPSRRHILINVNNFETFRRGYINCPQLAILYVKCGDGHDLECTPCQNVN
jgi:hypothetical protein